MIEKMLVEIWFLEGVRKKPPSGDTYRPHFVIENTNNYYCGVQFDWFSEKPFGEHFIVEVQLLYKQTGVDYSLFKKGTNFDIREGANTVGKGFVI